LRRQFSLGTTIEPKFNIVCSCPEDSYLSLEDMGHKALFDSWIYYLRENYKEGDDFEVFNESNWAYNKGCRYLGVKAEIAKELSERFCGQFPPGFEDLVSQYEVEYARENGYVWRSTGYECKSSIEEIIKRIASNLAEKPGEGNQTIVFPKEYNDIKIRDPDFYKELEEIFWDEINWWE